MQPQRNENNHPIGEAVIRGVLNGQFQQAFPEFVLPRHLQPRRASVRTRSHHCFRWSKTRTSTGILDYNLRILRHGYVTSIGVAVHVRDVVDTPRWVSQALRRAKYTLWQQVYRQMWREHVREGETQCQ